MACEKLCKAYLIRAGVPVTGLQGSHAYVAKHLHNILKQEMVILPGRPVQRKAMLRQFKLLAGEIEVLSPAVERGGKRPDNCEYPWESGGSVFSPLDQPFSALSLIEQPSGVTFLKFVRVAINRLL